MEQYSKLIGFTENGLKKLEDWKKLNITFLELFPITVALHVWGCQMENQCVSFFTDNAALVDILNKQTSKHPLVMILVRDLVIALQYSF